MIHWSVAIVAASALGCASAQSRGATVTVGAGRPSPEQQIKAALEKGADPASIKICDWEETTGTHIRDWNCRYLDTKEVERISAQNYLMKMQQVPARVSGN